MRIILFPNGRWADYRGGTGSDPGLLLDLLRHTSENHMGKIGSHKSFWERFLAWLNNLFSGAVKKNDQSFGYVAEAWKNASHDVFRSIEERGDLVTSPPYGKDTEIPVPITRYGYFQFAWSGRFSRMVRAKRLYKWKRRSRLSCCVAPPGYQRIR